MGHSSQHEMQQEGCIHSHVTTVHCHLPHSRRTSQPADAHVQPIPDIDDRDYPPHTKALMVLVGLLSVVYWSFRLLAWTLGLFGAYQASATGLLLAYLAMSFARAFQPVQPAPYIAPVSSNATPVKATETGPDVPAN